MLLHSIPVPVTEQQAERVNRNVMDRIYAESPWLLPEEAKVNRFSAAIRKHMSLWIAAFLAIFYAAFCTWRCSSQRFQKLRSPM